MWGVGVEAWPLSLVGWAMSVRKPHLRERPTQLPYAVATAVETGLHVDGPAVVKGQIEARGRQQVAMGSTAITHGADALPGMGRDTPGSSPKEWLQGLRAVAKRHSLSTSHDGE